MKPNRTLPILVALSALTVAHAALAQTPNIRVAGRVQTQFAAYAGDSSASWNPHAQANSSFEVRRLRIQADVRIGENITMVLQPSFEMSSLRLRDAYLRVVLAHNATSGFGLTMGQEKKPFNRYELTSSNNLLSIERGLRFQGLGNQIVAQNNLLEDNGYVAHDIGASADVYGAGSRVQLKVGVYNGSGESSRDVNNAKTFAGRLTGTILRDEEQRPILRAGVAFISRDRAITTTATGTVFTPDSSKRTSAFGIDAEWGDFRPGLHVIADFASGKALQAAPGLDQCLNGTTPIPCRIDGSPRNFGNLRANTPSSSFATFLTFQAVAAWRVQFEDPNGERLIKIVEPALRLDYTDPNTSTGSNQAVLITPVLNVYFTQTTLVRAGIDLYAFHDATGAGRSLRALRISWQSNF
jgi:hypothetical protein